MSFVRSWVTGVAVAAAVLVATVEVSAQTAVHEGEAGETGQLRHSNIRLTVSLDVSPDSQLLVTGGAGRIAQVWDMQGYAVGSPMEHPPSKRNGIKAEFSPDGQTILTSGP